MQLLQDNSFQNHVFLSYLSAVDSEIQEWNALTQLYASDTSYIHADFYVCVPVHMDVHIYGVADMIRRLLLDCYIDRDYPFFFGYGLAVC